MEHTLQPFCVGMEHTGTEEHNKQSYGCLRNIASSKHCLIRIMQEFFCTKYLLSKAL